MGKNKNKKRSKKGGNNNKKRNTTTTTTAATTEPTVVEETTPVLNAETQDAVPAAKRPSDITTLPEPLQKGWDQLTAKQQVLAKLLCSLGQEHLFAQENAVACAVQVESLNETCPLPAFLMDKVKSPQDTSKTVVKSLELKDLSSVAFVYVDESGKTSDLETSLKSVLRLQLESETKLPVVVLTTAQTVIDVTKKTLKDANNSQVSIVAPVLCPVINNTNKMVLNDKGLVATQVSTDAWLASSSAKYAAFLKDDVVVSEDGISITAVQVKDRVPCILLVEKKAAPVIAAKKATPPVVELLPESSPKVVTPSSPTAAAVAEKDDSSPRSVVGTPKAAAAATTSNKGVVVDLMAPNPQEVTNKADDECSCVIL